MSPVYVAKWSMLTDSWGEIGRQSTHCTMNKNIQKRKQVGSVELRDDVEWKLGGIQTTPPAADRTMQCSAFDPGRSIQPQAPTSLTS